MIISETRAGNPRGGYYAATHLVIQVRKPKLIQVRRPKLPSETMPNSKYKLDNAHIYKI
jgi:hypothetical protein